MDRTKKELLNGMDEQAFNIRCSIDFAFFCERVISDGAGKPLIMKDYHKDWCKLLSKHKRLVLSAPTGFGKTQIFGIARPLWLAIYKPYSKSIVISKVVKGQSSSILEAIKMEVETNEFLRDHLKPADSRLSWTKDSMTCKTGARIFLKAYSASIRGDHVDYIFGDEVAIYPDRVDQYKIWFRDVSSRVSNRGGQIVAVSTPVEPGDLLDVLIRNKTYFSKSYPGIVNYKDKDVFSGESIWPERFPIAKLKQILDEQGEINFARNIMVDRSAEVTGAIFKIKDLYACLDYKRDFDSKILDENGLTFIGSDFAMSDGPQADFDAYVVLEKTSAGISYIKHLEVHKGLPTNEKVQRLLYLSKIYKPYAHLIDKSNVGRDVSRSLMNAGESVEEVTFSPQNRGNMLGVLKSMVENKNLIIPYPEDEEFSETRNLIDDLIHQLIGFKEEKSEKTRMTTIASRSAHDDIAMALAMACKGASEQYLEGEDTLWSGS